MIAVILAAGKGSRLQSVEPDVPKCMVKFNGLPVLNWTILHMVHMKIQDIVITIGHMGHVIQDHFGDGSKWDLRITYSVEDELLGTAGGVKRAMKGRPYDPIIVWHGDNVSTCNLQRMMAYHRAHRGDGTIAVCWREDATKSSIIGWDITNRINHFQEKPKIIGPTHGWISAGIYILEPWVWSTIPDIRAVDFGHDIFPQTIEQKRELYAYGFSHDEWLRWYDTPEDLARLRADYGQ